MSNYFINVYVFLNVQYDETKRIVDRFQCFCLLLLHQDAWCGAGSLHQQCFLRNVGGEPGAKMYHTPVTPEHDILGITEVQGRSHHRTYKPTKIRFYCNLKNAQNGQYDLPYAYFEHNNNMK